MVSGNGCPTERISRFVDHFLNPLSQKVKSYIKDTTHFLNIINTISDLPENTLLVSLDVKSLYTNIPQQEGIETCKSFLNQRPDQTIPTSFITNLLEHILGMNHFTFNDKHYLQILGTAMGTRVAPTFANLFMADLENKFLNTCTLKPLIWLRYIDDIFCLWTHGTEELNKFIDNINNFHNTIKFTHTYSHDSMSFLDVLLNIKDGSIETDLFTKPTDTHQYLHFTSSHPTHCKKSLPFSLALRLRRICSSNNTFQQRLEELKQLLLRRGFPSITIKTQFNKVLKISRAESLKTKPKTKTKKIPFTTTYNPRLQGIQHILRKNLATLHISPRMKAIIPEAPITAWKKCKSLKDLLVKSKLSNNIPATPEILGTHQCEKTRCKMCLHINNKNTFISTQTNESFQCQNSTNCNTNNIIYLITCNRCKSQYVGQTQHNLQTRFRNHRFNINNKNMHDTIGYHFNTNKHNLKDMSVQIIEKVKTNNIQTRLKRENYWINKLKTLQPLGLNVREESQHF